MSIKSKIFVDGNCIVCDMEIAHYKRIAPELFDIVDINADGFDAKKYGLTPEGVQKNMHLLTSNGELKVGVDAFAHIWSQIVKYSFAAKAIRWPIVYPLAKVGYKVFATIRPLLPKMQR